MLNFVVVVAATGALASTSLAAYRAVVPPKPVIAPIATEVDDWKSYVSRGHRFGSETAPVTIVEFSDFECPFCKTAATRLKEIVANHQGTVAVLFRHFPLDAIHKYARPAAIAAECASRQGRFEAFHDTLFAQDSLGNSSWTRLAHTVGIRDTTSFSMCLVDPAAEAAVDSDVEDAVRLKATGTPTFLINQFRLEGIPDENVLDSLISLAMKPNKKKR